MYRSFAFFFFRSFTLSLSFFKKAYLNSDAENRLIPECHKYLRPFFLPSRGSQSPKRGRQIHNKLTQLLCEKTVVTKVQNVMTPQNTSPRPSNHGRCHQEVKKPCILWISEESDEQQGMRNAEGSKWAEAQKITLSLLRASTAVLRTQRSSVPQASVSEVSFLLYLATRGSCSVVTLILVNRRHCCPSACAELSS